MLEEQKYHRSKKIIVMLQLIPVWILLPLVRLRVQRWVVFSLLLLGTWGMIISCSPSVDGVKNLHLGQGEQIIILGDSIAYGLGVSSEQAFPSLLSRQLNVEILNQGVSGDTTAMGLNRLESDVLDENPWLVMVELGANDYLRKIPEAKTEENLRQIITRIHAEGAIVVLLGVNVGVVGDNHKEMFERLAQETQVYLIPQILQGILSNPKYRQDDIIHPNAAGHEVISDRVFKSLQPLLKQAKIPPSLDSLNIEN